MPIVGTGSRLGNRFEACARCGAGPSCVAECDCVSLWPTVKIGERSNDRPSNIAACGIANPLREMTNQMGRSLTYVRLPSVPNHLMTGSGPHGEDRVARGQGVGGSVKEEAHQLCAGASSETRANKATLR